MLEHGTKASPGNRRSTRLSSCSVLPLAYFARRTAPAAILDEIGETWSGTSPASPATWRFGYSRWPLRWHPDEAQDDVCEPRFRGCASMQSLQFALTNAHAGRAVLFVGSGFATEATSVLDKQMPTGATFCANLARAVHVPETTGLDRVAQLFSKDFSENKLIETVINTFTAKHVSKNQIDILSVPWREIYTTNYDDVVEKASAQLNQSVIPVTFSDPLPRANRQPRCIHLNGYVSRIRSIGDIRLTTASYAAVSLNASPWATRLRRSLSNAGSVFFVGYSVYDLDITRILREDPTVHDKTHFFNGPNPDRVTQATIEPFGQIHDLGISELAMTIIKSKPAIPLEPAPFFTSFQVYTLDDTNERPSDDDVFALLVKGHLSKGRLANALADDEVDNYLVYREGARRALAILEEGSDVLLHANIGNGKTVCTEIIFAAGRAGYDTYRLDNHYARFLLESRTRSHGYDDYFVAFAKANRLLAKQMEATAQGYYPYRVARLYADFIRARGSTFDERQLATFESCCDSVIKRIAGASAILLTYPVVRECRERMVEALSLAASFKSPPPTRRPTC